MSSLKPYAICLILSAWCIPAVAQQYGLYSQYIFNPFAINPAYAGARDALSVNATYRAQWVGLEGAPRTQNFNIHSPLPKEKMALGLQFQNDAIGARNATFAALAYAYRLQLDESGRRRLSMALQMGVINYQFDWNALDYRNPGDPVIQGSETNFWLPSLDFGLMYTAPRFFAGFSAVGLQRTKLAPLSDNDERLGTFLNVHAGHISELNAAISLKVHGLIRHEWNAGMQGDVGMALGLYNKAWLGMLYRQSFGWVYHAQLLAAKGLVIGYAFDWATNGLKAAQNGTHEVYLGIDLFGKPELSTNMRYY